MDIILGIQDRQHSTDLYLMPEYLLGLSIKIQMGYSNQFRKIPDGKTKR
jgi:hypothetical protein